MELLRQEEKQNWYALLGAIVGAFLIATGAGYLLEAVDEGDTGRASVVQRSAYEPDDPQIAQAPWKVHSHPSATFGKPTKKQIKALKRLSPRIGDTVRNVYDALLVSRNQLPKATRRWLAPIAARELRKTPPVPRTLEAIETTRRRASIGVDLSTRKRAAADVQISFRAQQGKKTLRFSHRGTLWLEHSEKGWRVIAFDMLQRRRA